MQENFDLKELMELLDTRQLRRLKEILMEMNEVDIASFIEELDSERTVVVFRMLSKEVASDVFANLPVEKQEHIINSITDYELSAIVNDLFVDDAVDMLEELPANVVKRVLKNSTSDTRKLINQFLKYPENSAGSIMTAEYVGLKKTMTVEQAFAYIRRNGVDKETIYTCYVMDAKRTLEGVVTVKDLLMNPYDEVIGSIMDTHVISANTLDDQEDVAQTLNKYDFLALPIVDTENRLVGIVTVDDAMDVLQEEVTEDIEKMAAILPGDKPYLKTGVFETWRARTPWLMMLMLSATFTGMILTHFENSLAAVPILTSYIPMLSGTGGNSGTQASTAVIRALSLGEVRFSDLLRVVWKECRVALICGVCLAAANFVKMMVVDCWLLANPTVTPAVAAVVCCTLVGTVACAKLVGASLPILAEKIGFDPAVMASPFISTIVDALSLLIYFRFATWILGV